VTPARLLLSATLLAVLTLGPAGAALAGDHREVQTKQPEAVTATSATFKALVHPRGTGDSFRFEYGTWSYQRATDWVAEPEATVEGLAPDAPHYVRVVIWRDGRRTEGNLVLFRTAPAPIAPPAPAPTTPLPGPAIPQPVDEPQPVIGDSVVVAPAAGTVKVKAPGGDYTTLAAGDAIPVGSLVDTRAGTVRLTSAVPGATQTGEFRGALFQVKQGASGMTDIVLRGAELNSCRRTAPTARTSARRKKPPVRRLWASDRNGRFRTHGRHSVATVRGTRWVTTETCAGTRTTVTEGAVSVRDLRTKKSVLVRAGRSYIARRAR
jgi:hypothetical protein